MPARQPWNETECRAAIRAYFKLMQVQESGSTINKAATYRQLAKQFPSRTAKAWEWKFQNISAILYEEHRPYLDGLKPRFNYQALLRACVLVELGRRAPSLPGAPPKDILIGKLKALSRRGYLPTLGKGSGRFGLTLEHHLGIPPNNSRQPDFMGIELKTKRGSTLQTLFSRVPTNWGTVSGQRGFIEKYGRNDPGTGRLKLNTSVNCHGDTLGFSLKTEGFRVLLRHSGATVLEYDAAVLEAALHTKLNKAAFLNVVTTDRGTRCRFDRLLYCESPSVIRLLQMVDSGDASLDFLLSATPEKVRNHGCLWRVRPESITRLFLRSDAVDLSS